MGWVRRNHRAKSELHGDAEGQGSRDADCEEGLDLEMGRRLSVTGCVARSGCQLRGRIAHSFVSRVLDILGG